MEQRTTWKKIKAINGNTTTHTTPALKSNGQLMHSNMDFHYDFTKQVSARRDPPHTTFSKLSATQLLEKRLLLELQLISTTIKLIHNFFQHWEIKASSHHHTSTQKPQGAVLSPLLFIIFTSDIYHPPPTTDNILQFADGLCYWTSLKSPPTCCQKTIQMH